MISIRKRGRVYQYCFEAGKLNGKGKQITKSRFKKKNETFAAGQTASEIIYNRVDAKKAWDLRHGKILLMVKY